MFDAAKWQQRAEEMANQPIKIDGQTQYDKREALELAYPRSTDRIPLVSSYPAAKA